MTFPTTLRDTITRALTDEGVGFATEHGAISVAADAIFDIGDMTELGYALEDLGCSFEQVGDRVYITIR